mgnify:CR=1 FL=1
MIRSDANENFSLILKNNSDIASGNWNPVFGTLPALHWKLPSAFRKQRSLILHSVQNFEVEVENALDGWENCFVLCYKKPSLTVSETKRANLKIDRGKSWLGHFLFVFHDWDWLDNLVGRGPHAWVEKVQSHGNHCRDKSGISAEIVSGKGLR